MLSAALPDTQQKCLPDFLPLSASSRCSSQRWLGGWLPLIDVFLCLSPGEGSLREASCQSLAGELRAVSEGTFREKTSHYSDDECSEVKRLGEMAHDFSFMEAVQMME